MTARVEMSLLIRFITVGTVITALHLVLAFALVVRAGWTAQSANMAAFAVAFGLSFISHYRITFRSRHAYCATFARFMISAGVAYTASVVLLWVLETYTSLDPALCVVMGASIIPLITYAAGRWWVF